MADISRVVNTYLISTIELKQSKKTLAKLVRVKARTCMCRKASYRYPKVLIISQALFRLRPVYICIYETRQSQPKIFN